MTRVAQAKVLLLLVPALSCGYGWFGHWLAKLEASAMHLREADGGRREDVLHLPPAPVTAEDLAGSSNCGLRLDVTCSRSPRQRKKEGCLTPDAEGLQSRC
eukprot:s466_g17.t1